MEPAANVHGKRNTVRPYSLDASEGPTSRHPLLMVFLGFAERLPHSDLRRSRCRWSSGAMDPEARRRACVAFRGKLSRDTGIDLSATNCEGLLSGTFEGEGGEEVSLKSDPGLFYVCLGNAIADQTLVLPNSYKVAWWCYREAAEVHTHPGGTAKLAVCYYTGRGVTEDTAQAAIWFQKAADLGDAGSKAALGALLLTGDARAGVAKDAARGFALLSEAVDQGHGMALFHSATWRARVWIRTLLMQCLFCARSSRKKMFGKRTPKPLLPCATRRALVWMLTQCRRRCGASGPRRAAPSRQSRTSQPSGGATSAAQHPPASCASAAGRCATATTSASWRTGITRRTRTRGPARSTAAAPWMCLSMRRAAPERPCRRTSRNLGIVPAIADCMIKLITC